MLKPIDLEVYTPLDYWRTEAAYPPEGTEERFQRFQTYRDLSRGALDAILPDWLKNANPVQTNYFHTCLLYTSPSPRDRQKSRMPSSA